MASNGDTRLAFQECMSLAKLPPPPGEQGPVRRFMSRRAAYRPGGELPETPLPPGAGYGGHVYAQSALAVCRTLDDTEEKGKEKLGIHTIHGYFTLPGVFNRPFIYQVTPMSTSRSFTTLSVTARQPLEPSANPQGDHFPFVDALLPLSTPSFTAICSFKLPEEDSAGVNKQEHAPQKRYADILSSRPTEDWPPAPPLDVNGIISMVGADIVGDFPAVDGKKVDMLAFNEHKPVHERRELVLYRLLRPLPSDGSDGWDANAHLLVHAYSVDRNGVLMVANHIGFGWTLTRAASLSYSFVVHTNPEEAIMHHQDEGKGGGGGGWWVQESSFPRAASGRGIIMTTIWSPEGVHVATMYQDGIIRGQEDPELDKAKL